MPTLVFFVLQVVDIKVLPFIINGFEAEWAISWSPHRVYGVHESESPLLHHFTKVGKTQGRDKDGFFSPLFQGARPCFHACFPLQMAPTFYASLLVFLEEFALFADRHSFRLLFL